MAETQRWQALPTQLELAEFEQFVLPHLSIGSRGPAPKLSLYKIFNSLQLRFEDPVSGLSVEGAADPQGWRRPAGNALHAYLPHLAALGRQRLHGRDFRWLGVEAS